MTRDELAEDVTMTIADLSAKIREAVLAGNSAAAEQWASALWNACSAYDYLSDD